MRALLASTPRRPTYTKLDFRGSEQKPLFRGFLHAFAALAIPFSSCFSVLPESTPLGARFAFFTFVASCFCCYAISSIYHIGSFSDRVSAWLQRIDQGCIFFLTAGSYTPSALMASSALQSSVFLFVVWSFAFVGAWHVVMHNRLGWFVISAASALPFMAIWVLPYVSIVQILLAFGVWSAYAVGFASYVTTKPRLIPTVFGYHEVFHVCVVVAGVCTAHFNQEVVQYYTNLQPQIRL
jgi:hemolysin III